MAICASCGEETVFEADPSNGSAYCPLCGAVSEENGIVSEVTFGETGSGAAVVTGSYVGADQTRARFGGGGRRPGGGGVESREQTISNGRRAIQGVVNSFKLPDRFADQALRFYTLALNSNFTRGRKVLYVVAACVYIVCRIETKAHMLIDFSDSLEINVFVLGSTYMKLVKELELKNIKVIDPAIYISRFAELLEFGEQRAQVASDATRLVARFCRDWMSAGRRPAGICGACLILAARMNNFRRSIAEVVQVVKIADVTIRKRLEEFANTDISNLTIQDWRITAANGGAGDDDSFIEAADPPSFTASMRKDKLEREKRARKAALAERRRVRFGRNVANGGEELSDLDEGDEEAAMAEGGGVAEANGDDPDQEMSMLESPDNALRDLNAEVDALDANGSNGLAEEEEEEDLAADEEEEEDLNMAIGGLDAEGAIGNALASIGGEKASLSDNTAAAGPRKRGRPSRSEPPTQAQILGWNANKEPPADTRTPEEIARDEAEAAALASDITSELSTKHFSRLSSELADKERARYIAAQTPSHLYPTATTSGNQTAEDDGRLSDLDEEELDALILTEEEVRVKERLWMEFNKDYLEKVAEKHIRAELDEKPLKKRERKKRYKPRDSTTALGETAADSTKQLLKQKKFSKKINYAAIDSLLGGDDDGFGGGDGADDGGGGSKKRTTLFDDDNASEQWENGSSRAGSRAGSLAPSIGSNYSGRGNGRKKKRKRSSVDDTEENAERLRKKLQKQVLPGSSRNTGASSSSGIKNKVFSAEQADATFAKKTKKKTKQGREAENEGHASPNEEEPPATSPEGQEEGQAEPDEEEEEEKEEEEEEGAQPEPPVEEEDEATKELRAMMNRGGEEDEEGMDEY